MYQSHDSWTANTGLIDAYVYQKDLLVIANGKEVSVNHWDFKKNNLSFSTKYKIKRLVNSQLEGDYLLEKTGEIFNASSLKMAPITSPSQESVGAGLNDDFKLRSIHKIEHKIELNNEFERSSLTVNSIAVYAKYLSVMILLVRSFRTLLRVFSIRVL